MTCRPLRRPCKDCNIMFQPYSRSNRVCDSCRVKITKRAVKKIRSKTNFSGKAFYLR